MQETPPTHLPPPPPLMWPGGRSLTEGLEDAVAGLVVVLRVRPVRGVLCRTLLPLLVSWTPAVAPPTPVALGHMHTNVNGVVTCWREGTERKRETQSNSQKETFTTDWSNNGGAALKTNNDASKDPPLSLQGSSCLHNITSSLHAVLHAVV